VKRKRGGESKRHGGKEMEMLSQKLMIMVRREMELGLRQERGMPSMDCHTYLSNFLRVLGCIINFIALKTKTYYLLYYIIYASKNYII